MRNSFYIRKQLIFLIILVCSIILKAYKYQSLYAKSKSLYFEKFEQNTIHSVHSAANHIQSIPNNEIKFDNLFNIWDILQQKYEIIVKKEKIATNNSSLILSEQQVINNDFLYNPTLNYNNNNNTNNRNQYNLYNRNVINDTSISFLTNLQSYNHSKIQSSNSNNDLITTTFTVNKSNKDITSNNELIPIKLINNTLNKRPNLFRYIKRKVKSYFTKDVVEIKSLQNKSISIKDPKKQVIFYPTAPATVSYTPKGLMENIVRVVRRRFLNLVTIIIDRKTNNQWANSVTTSNMRSHMNIRFATIQANRDTNKVIKQTELSNKTTILNVLGKVTRPIRNFLSQSRSTESMLFDDFEASSYMTQYLLSRDVSELVDSSYEGLNLLGYTKSSNNNKPYEELKFFDKFKKIFSSIFDKDKTVISYYKQNIPLKQIEMINDIEIQAENLFSTPVVKDMKYFRNNLFGAFVSIFEEYRESGYQTARNIMNSSVGNQLRDSVSIVASTNEAQSVVKSIDLTAESLKNLYQASVELAQESTDKVKQWLPSPNTVTTVSSMDTANVSMQQNLLHSIQTIAPKIPSFVMPWDKYYRGEIPFFETFKRHENENMSNPPLMSTRDIMASMAATATTTTAVPPIIESMREADISLNNPLLSAMEDGNNIDSKATHVKSRFVRMLFPLSATFLKTMKLLFLKNNPSTAIIEQSSLVYDALTNNSIDEDNEDEDDDDKIENKRIVTNEYSELFSNDIGAINAAWEEAHPILLSTSTTTMEENISIDNMKEDIETKSSIFSYAWKSLINSVPAFHMYKAYKYIRGGKLDTDEIVKLAQQDEETAPLEYEDDELLDIDVLPTTIQPQINEKTMDILKRMNKQILNKQSPSMMESFTISQQDQQPSSITSSSTNFINNMGKDINNGVNQQLFKRINPSQSSVILINSDHNATLVKPQELRRIPEFFEINAINQPTRADFNYIISRRVQVAIEAALAIRSDVDADEFFQYIGLGPIIGALLDRIPEGSNIDKIDAVKALCRIVRTRKSIALEIVSQPAIITVFCDMMEAPLKGFISLQSQSEKDRNLRGQTEVVALIQRLVRSHPKSAELIGKNEKIRKILNAIIETDPSSNSSPCTPLSPVVDAETVRKSSGIYSKNYKVKTPSNSSHTVEEYINLRPSQMARVAYWGLGGINWKPKQPGQTGLRILSLDGGGTRGVLSIAYLKEIMRRVNKNSPVHLEPYQLFDVICGTSTGGIIAVLLGAQKTTLAQTEALYDDFIGKVFTSKSTLKLILEKASYDEKELEDILYKMCGDQLLLDSNQNECSRVFCVSSDLTKVPARPFLWRNYNYPPGQVSRYDGACIVNTKIAVRATAAAPTFFKPVNWNGVNYADGALVANNPSLIAIHEARALYPNIPIEFIVSVGTGYVNMTSDEKTVEWGGMLGTIIGSATDTEPVHRTMEDFFPKEQYHRFSTSLAENYAIDETNKTVLNSFKKLAVTSIRQKESSSDIENVHLQKLIKALRCGINTR